MFVVVPRARVRWGGGEDGDGYGDVEAQQGPRPLQAARASVRSRV